MGKLSSYPTGTPSSNDYVPYIDVASGDNKKVRFSNIGSGGGGGGGDDSGAVFSVLASIGGNTPIVDSFWATVPANTVLWLQEQNDVSEKGLYVTDGTDTISRVEDFELVSTHGVLISVLYNSQTFEDLANPNVTTGGVYTFPAGHDFTASGSLDPYTIALQGYRVGVNSAGFNGLLQGVLNVQELAETVDNLHDGNYFVGIFIKDASGLTAAEYASIGVDTRVYVPDTGICIADGTDTLTVEYANSHFNNRDTLLAGSVKTLATLGSYLPGSEIFGWYGAFVKGIPYFLEGTNINIEEGNADLGYNKTLTFSLGWANVPSTASSTGTAGQIAYDSGYFYICIATDTWKRAALSTW